MSLGHVRPSPANTPGPMRGGAGVSARSQPYPTHSGVKASRHAGGAGSSHAPRALLREKWAKVFGGPSFLEPSPQNRLVLSLRSQLPAEVDFALQRLVQVSGEDAELLHFSDHPNLLSALLAVIRTLLDASANGADSFLGISSNHHWETSKRRATEAALVVRNIAIDLENVPALLKSQKLPQLVVDVLELGLEQGYAAEETTELRLYALEVLEVIGEGFALALPAQSKTGGPPDNANSPAVRLFPILAGLVRSPDRAVVLASFRALVALSRNERSEPTLSIFSYNSLDVPLSYPHPVQTAIGLLPLLDSELTTVALDFIYQHTIQPANAVEFCARPDLLQILRLVCSKLLYGGKLELLTLDLPLMDNSQGLTKTPQRRHRIRFGGFQGTAVTLALDQATHAQLNALPEPARALQWMRTVFEAHAGGEVTQVALWTAYRGSFESTTGPPILPAGDVIKMASEAFSTAVPMVTAERKFIIKGIRGKDRTDLTSMYQCRWNECATPLGYNTAQSLYSHLHSAHIENPSVPATACSFAKCAYTPSPSSLVSPARIVKDLSLHVRTHMPVYQPPEGYGDPPASALIIPFDHILPDPKTTMPHVRHHAQVDDNGESVGLGFVASLVLRTVARTIKAALGNPAGGAGVRQLAEHESIFEAMSAAAEGNSAKRDDLLSRLENVDYSEAAKGVDALLSLEPLVVERSFGSHGLSKVLSEVVVTIAFCGAWMVKKAAAASVVAAVME